MFLCRLTDLGPSFQNLPDGRAHNVLTNDESGFAYVVGARPRTSECRSGLIFLDLEGLSGFLTSFILPVCVATSF